MYKDVSSEDVCPERGEIINKDKTEYIEKSLVTEEIVERVLDVKIKVRTNKNKKRTIVITDFFKPQDVKLTCNNNEVILCVKMNKDG